MKKLSEIAIYINAELKGDGEIEIVNVAPIEEAGAGEITFISTPKYLKMAAFTKASAVITGAEIKDIKAAQLVMKNPYLGFAKVLELFYPQANKSIGISRLAYVPESARIGKNVSIYPFAYIGEDAEIGDNTVVMSNVYLGDKAKVGTDTLIHPNSFIGDRCIVGNRVILQSGVRIGSDGYGYVKEEERHRKIPQVGIVELEDDVELGANVTVDRGTLGATLIKKGTKVDNLVQIGHNVTVGENCLLISQVGISGSTKIGNNVTLAGQVGVAGHVEIGDNVIVGAQSGVSGNVSSGQVVSGLPPVPHKEWLRAQASIPKLPEIRKTLHALKEKVEILEKKIKELEGGTNGNGD